MENYDNIGLLQDQFRKQAKASPSEDAVVYNGDDGDVTLTYKELDEKSDILADLLGQLGVIPEESVGIYMEKCPEYVIAYIAILKAGGAYIPMDLSYPVPLVEDILTDSRPIAVCVKSNMVQYLPGSQKVILMDKGWESSVQEQIRLHGSIPLATAPNLDSLAYIVYSSGTTGKPKGIQCPQRGAVFSYHWRHLTYPYADGDREACNIFFVWELLRPLMKGVPLYIIPDTVIYDPVLLCSYIEHHQITRMLFTPSLLEAVLDMLKGKVTQKLKSMRLIIFCGEVVTTGLLTRCMSVLPHVHFINLYSVSETHDVSCSDLNQWYHKKKGTVTERQFCPVGKVLPGVSVVILDDSFNVQPVGVPGEIYVAGPTLARGYLNRPELNGKRFFTRPSSVPESYGSRLYKTGDWGYILSDGSFEICGRCDSMVKVRGYSVETQAIESTLLQLPMVKACVVLALGDEGDDKFLAAYIVSAYTTSKKVVRAELKKKLPFYMIPSYYVFLSSIPILAASGKLDKKSLPPIDRSQGVDIEGLPSSPTECQLVTLWAQVLQLKQVDTQESFFDLGGHSLLAARLLGQVLECFGIELSVRDLFVHSTITAMANLIDTIRRDGFGKKAWENVRVDLQQEVNKHDQEVLGLDIQLRAFWRSMQYTQRWESGRVLLTGATGFLGVFLLRDLLKFTKTSIFCLVRELPDQKGTDRLKVTMTQFGILSRSEVKVTEEQEYLLEQFNKRVHTIKGDVGLICMGLSEEDYTYLSTEIDFIIHAAAYVNLIYPYQALHGPNVLGTQNVILFACASKIKPLHYISTDAVFPHGLENIPEDYNMQLCWECLSDGYSQSKWVAEQLVLRAMDRGLPAVVYRLGNLSGENLEGHWNPKDMTLLILQGCLYTGLAPELPWEMELTPVDYVSHLVVSMCNHMALGLRQILHVVNTKTIQSRWLFEWLCAHGYPVKMVAYEQWLASLDNCKHKLVKDLKNLLDNLPGGCDYFGRLSTYTNENLQKIIKVLKLDYPVINSSLLQTYMTGLSRRNVVPRVRRNTIADQPLQGHVAIVTGASSGIGAAIALHLARAGALVALVARREEKLCVQKCKIEEEGGIAIAIKCDVTKRSEVQAMVERVESTLGSVDILVNNAGVMYYTMMKNLQEDQWNQQVDLNCKGILNTIGATLDSMLIRGQGHIVNLSSDAGRLGFPGLAVYSGTKFFVEGLSQAMRKELAKTGVKITCIQPGDVKTELLTHTTDLEAKAAYDGSQSTKILDGDDIGRAVVYAVTQPAHCAVNEILIEPREAPI